MTRYQGGVSQRNSSVPCFSGPVFELSARQYGDSGESHKLYEQLVLADPSPIAVARVHDGQFLFMNPAARVTLGIESDAAELPRAASVLFSSSDRELFARKMQACLRAEKFEVKLRSLHGLVFWVELTARSIVFQNQDCAILSLADVTERKELEIRLRNLAETDPLTGLWNRRKFFDELKQESERVERYRRPCSVVSIDVDHFKRINDSHGHGVGDRALVHLAGVMHRELRPSDVLGRIGGEEFAVVMPETGLTDALDAAERCRAAVLEAPLAIPGGLLHLTISLGATTLCSGDRPESVMHLVDVALYQAKRCGRNTVVAYDRDADSPPGEAERIPA